ncbi:TIMELESS-interacting protein isoform X2 [Salvelinus namaycush]|uniref:TIMELESS-interacting protein n=1 Tax=Salvelinus namaycush TaxID=8040 RepID=A0A8U0TQH7_SALNM|nr:TIMELESS-interacting protein isoform X2 [Salvelinus namaycush]
MAEPMENGLFDIPDYDNIDDETFPPLPPPFSPGEGGDPFTGEEDGEISKLAEVPAAKRRGVKRPQPKLDSQRLTSERGLPALRTLFDNVHFKGKGHEAEDLKVLMQRMENWAHRLYPKLQFEDFIDKLETLGSKKEVQTCLKRIRLDMPLIHEDFIGDDGEDEAVASRDGRDVNHDDPDPFGDGGFAEDPPGLVPSTPAAAPSLFPSSQAGPVHSTPAPSLTEEQQRRIELNKRLALERRLARMQHHTDGSQEITSSQSADGPSTSQSQEMATQSADGPSTSQSQEMATQSADGPSTSQSQEMATQSADGPSTPQSQEMASTQSADGHSTSQSQEMATQSADGPSTSQSQEMATQSADGPSTRSSSHPFPSHQQDGEDEDPDQGDPEDKGQSRPDHPRDRALNTASPAEADSLVCEGAVASPVPEMSNDSSD